MHSVHALWWVHCVVWFECIVLCGLLTACCCFCSAPLLPLCGVSQGETSASHDVTSNIERSKHLDNDQQAKIYKAEVRGACQTLRVAALSHRQGWQSVKACRMPTGQRLVSVVWAQSLLSQQRVHGLELMGQLCCLCGCPCRPTPCPLAPRPAQTRQALMQASLEWWWETSALSQVRVTSPMA
jgi:hypothetical protein